MTLDFRLLTGVHADGCWKERDDEDGERRIIRVDFGRRFFGFAAATTGGDGGGFCAFAFFAVCFFSTGGRVFAKRAARVLTVVWERFRLAVVDVAGKSDGSSRVGRVGCPFARNRSTIRRTSSMS